MTTKINPITDLKSELKPVQKKILSSGLIDRSMAELMEKWGNLPSGSASLVPKDDAFKNATREFLYKFSEDLAGEVEKEHVLRETYLDLKMIRWPAVVTVNSTTEAIVALNLAAVVDRMGRYYFRIQDVDKEWFVPGFTISTMSNMKKFAETILESQILYDGSVPVCIQVSTSGKKEVSSY